MFGGKKYNFGETSGKVYVFALTSDVVQQSGIPFASANSMPNEGNGFASPLFAKEQNTGDAEDGSRPVWLQASFALGTGESSGQSFVNVALGEWSSDNGLTGSRRGSSDTASDNYSFSGDVRSVAGPDGGHFLGASNGQPNAVLGLGTSGTTNPGRDNPLNGDTSYQNQIGSTHHIAVGTQTFDDVGTTSGTFHGYAAGFSQQAGDASNVQSLVNGSASEVVLRLSGNTNNLTASMRFSRSWLVDSDQNLLSTKTTQYEFGGSGKSSMIDGNIFGAFETSGSSNVRETGYEFAGYETKYRWKLQNWKLVKVAYDSPVFRKYDHSTTPDTTGYLISADAMGANKVLFAGQTVQTPNGLVQKQAFCQDCDYIKWGAWGMRSNYTNHNGEQVTEDTHLGWWITGNVVSASDMPTRGTAHYAGDVVGTVAKFNGQTWNQSVATGTMNMDWNFATRGLSPKDKLTISNFDGKTFSGRMFAPGKASFAGALTGNGGIQGSAAGSFVGSPGKGQTPRGVVGNFNARNSVLDTNATWKANGIFGGTQR
ncbi:hypothetical protein [Methyloceanibacter methanicus]|uniref:hypothetical protein n=1 Tax=Methyloceanibacter methanicus TaxID=1774968 RepID=UPI00114D28E5|nr:hypothetical protein [Methyloceanibacter methanicus]